MGLHWPDLDEDLSIAGTMAGIEDAVPLTPALKESLEKELWYELPVVFDVRTLRAEYPEGSDPRIEELTGTIGVEPAVYR
jgi:hypothetical protein